MTEIRTGCGFPLSNLFSGNTKIVIPDMQRDYCWGHDAFVKAEKVTRGLVDGFVRKLISLYGDRMPRNQKMILGLVYGYEEPSNSINVCDGQQRLTTLFLLLGMVNRRYGGFRRYLLRGDGAVAEARLCYSIRESTLYFINDLTRYFFVGEDCSSVSKVKEQEWYFKDYDTDPSIQNIISALQTIEDIFADETSGAQVCDFKDFGEYLLNSLWMIYYDMGTRTRGEETYIVINTTGEPLSSTENIKPIMLGNVKSKEQAKVFNDQWERREDWFWANRAPNEAVADEGLADFLKWTLQLREKVEDCSRGGKKLTTRDLFANIAASKNAETEISLFLEEIEEDFIALRLLLDFVEEQKKEEKSIGRIVTELGVSSFNAMRHAQAIDIVPLLAYVKKFGCDVNINSFLMRLWKAKSHKDRFGALDKWNLKKILELIDQAKTSAGLCRYDTAVSVDELKALLQSREFDSVWLDEDEQNKVRLIVETAYPQLNTIESGNEKLNSKAVVEHVSLVAAKIRMWEESDIFNGDLQPLWEACGNDLTVEKAERAYEIACFLEKCLSEPNKMDEVYSASTIRCANYYRLYRVLTGASPIMHFPNMSYNMLGVKFSWGSAVGDKRSSSYHRYLRDGNYLDLISCGSVCEMLRLLQRRIWEHVKKILYVDGTFALTACVKEETFDVVKYIKLWTAAKVLYANEVGVPISTEESTIAAYCELSENRTDSKIDFSLGNSRCGHPVLRRGRIEYLHENAAEDGPRYLDTRLVNGSDLVDADMVCQRLFQALEQMAVT